LANHERDRSHHSKPECRQRRNRPKPTEFNNVHSYQDKERGDQKVEGILYREVRVLFIDCPSLRGSATKNLIITDEVRYPSG
jgi:hypothetical protein